MRKQINHARRHATFNASELRRQGYRQIGQGAFSRVFVHPDAPDVVIKVGMRYSPLVGYVDGFPHFAELVLNKEISSKFYPRIYGLQWSPDRQHFWCIMKRYEKNRRSQIANNMSATVRAMTGKIFYSGTPTARFRRALEPFADIRFCDDIHAGNVMLDPKTNTPIVVDPICVEKRHEHAVYAHA